MLVLCRRAYELLLDVLGHLFFPLLSFLFLDSFLVLLPSVSVLRAACQTHIPF
jgi:hypothetical protein